MCGPSDSGRGEKRNKEREGVPWGFLRTAGATRRGGVEVSMGGNQPHSPGTNVSDPGESEIGGRGRQEPHVGL